ncbi:MAG: hypothetical protein QM775_01465 [Pirellulales bacterium]
MSTAGAAGSGTRLARGRRTPLVYALAGIAPRHAMEPRMTAPTPSPRTTRALLIVTIVALGLNVGLPALVASREVLEPTTRATVLYVLGGIGFAGLTAIVGQTFVGGKFFTGLGKLQFALCSMVLSCAAIEGLFTLAPSLFPGRLRSEVQQPDVERQRGQVVEYLPHAPFAKPKPDVVIRVPGYYGPPEQFEYEWRTDRRGFKNLPALAAKESFTAVAVGDSFTEGMGVRTEQTWASRLTRAASIRIVSACKATRRRRSPALSNITACR